MLPGAAPVGVVLAGGRSSRMGRDKSLVEIDGVPMALRVADALAGAGCSPVWCQGGDEAALAALGLTVRPDHQPGGGPLAAIATALRSAAPLDVVVVACDLPALDADTVRALIDAGRRGHGVVAVAADHRGTHLAAWWSAGAVGALDRLIGDGVSSYRAAVERLEATLVPVPATVMRNVNHPDDLD